MNLQARLDKAVANAKSIADALNENAAKQAVLRQERERLASEALTNNGRVSELRELLAEEATKTT